MNDADWLRKHVRGKVQRAAVETESSRGLKQRVRSLVSRVLRRLRPQSAQPPSSSQADRDPSSASSEDAT
jgi:hypothetical protein